MKYAVYVEGKAEMLFVADVLQKYSGFDPKKFGFRCITLNNDTYSSVSYPNQGDESSANFYQIVNINNDNLVVLLRCMPHKVNKSSAICALLACIWL